MNSIKAFRNNIVRVSEVAIVGFTVLLYYHNPLSKNLDEGIVLNFIIGLGVKGFVSLFFSDKKKILSWLLIIFALSLIITYFFDFSGSTPPNVT